ncbi:hypothetical protein ACA081_00810 [Candidatus Hodgkinia cicadicola]
MIDKLMVGLVLTGPQVGYIRRNRPDLGNCEVGYDNSHIWIKGLVPKARVKMLLTAPQLAGILTYMQKYNAGLGVSELLVAKRALLKATLCVKRSLKFPQHRS